jgi:hypothetical protein
VKARYQPSTEVHEFLDTGLPLEALKICLFMADGDQSLDGGYLGMGIPECHEPMTDLHAVKYWYGRAVEENPHVHIDCIAVRKRLEGVTMDAILKSVTKFLWFVAEKANRISVG